MGDPILSSLAQEEILLENNPLAVVTETWIVVRPAEGRERTMIAVHRLSDVRRIKTTHPLLLVIACALLIVAAASYFSKEGGGAAIPMAILGVLFGAGFLGTRRGSVVFRVHTETTETATGSLREARQVVAAVLEAQRRNSLRNP